MAIFRFEGYSDGMTFRLTIPARPTDAERDAIVGPLLAYNVSRAGDPGIRPVCVMLTAEDGGHVGGLWGKIVYGWMVVELLAVSDVHRGNGAGTMLLSEAERIALSHECLGIWLDTYDFQARGLYERFGFEVFGTIDDHPVGHRRFFLQKRF